MRTKTASTQPSPFERLRSELRPRKLTTRSLKPSILEETEDFLKPDGSARKTRLSLFERLELGMLGPSVSSRIKSGDLRQLSKALSLSVRPTRWA